MTLNAKNALALIQKLDHSELRYGKPPCAEHCGHLVSKCTDKGYFDHDVYMFWHDEIEGVCTSVKTPVPAPWKAGLTKSYTGTAFLGAFLAMSDGSLGLEDLIGLVAIGSQAAYYHN